MNLFNYISRKSKIFAFISNGSFFIAILILLYFYKDIFSNQNVAFYTFSTIVQGFLALIGFLGALAIFKIQLIENQAQKISEGLELFMEMYDGKKVYTYSWIEMMNSCSKILANNDSLYQRENLKIGYDKLCNLRDEKSPIRNTMVDFSIITMVNIMIALIGISLSSFFVNRELFFINTLYLLLSIILSFYSVKSAFNLIRACFGYSFSIT